MSRDRAALPFVPAEHPRRRAGADRRRPRAPRSRGPQRTAALLGLLSALGLGLLPPLLTGCPSRAQVVVKLQGAEQDALVTIDDEYVDKLAVLGRRGIKLPPGTYRVTVEKVGYFPWDRLVEVGDAPLVLDVELVPIPD